MVKANKNYASQVKVISSCITVIIRGNEESASNTGAMLSEEQKGLLKNLRNGDEFGVVVNFERQDTWKIGRIVEAATYVTILPHRAADFPGEISAFNHYLEENFWSKIKGNDSLGSINSARVRFWVNKNLSISKVKLARSAADEEVSQLILDVLLQMPIWIPAKNSRGERVEQEVKYSFGGC